MSYLESLNAAQREAVETTEGPVLVIAGPGTGKTQLLSSRVAHILATTDASAHSILCLTFTNKSALNMRDRIMRITNGAGRDAVVKTFHSFASDIMSMYPDHFWSGAKLVTAPDAVQHEILQSILTSLPLDNPLALKFAGAYTLVPDINQGLKLAKEAGLTPEKLAALIQINLAYIDTIEDALSEHTSARLSIKTLDDFAETIYSLPDQSTDALIAPLLSLSTVLKESLAHAIQQDKELGKTTNTGNWKKKWTQTVNGVRGMHSERLRNQWWLALAHVYELYRTELHNRKYYDYADMLVEVLTQLESNPELRADIQERFSYVMIDEFQDTNAAQLRLAHLISDHHAANGAPNIMVVGDDDQSIFKFNGAELSNMLSFKRSYPLCKLIVLTENYRSTQAVLDVADRVITNATDRLVDRDSSIVKQLHAANDDIAQGTISHTTYRSREEQLSSVAREIAQTYEPHVTTAVVARGHKSLREIASLLLSLNVPVHYEQQRNILDHEIVQQVTYLAYTMIALNAGDRESLNIYMSKTLRHPMWSIDSNTLWQLALDNYRGPDWLDSLLNHEDSALVEIGHTLLELSRVCNTEPLPVCIEYLLGLRAIEDNMSPVRGHFAHDHTITNDYLHGLSAMQLLRTMATEFSTNTEASIGDFVAFIASEKANGTVINDESPFVSGADAVSLLTVHKAKGLEFDTVYVIDAVEGNWQPRKGGRKPPANLPLLPHGDTLDDYARFMFVAVTRAKSTLKVASYQYDMNGSEVLITPLINTAVPAVVNTQQIDPVIVVQESLQWPRLETANERQLIAGRLATYSLSVTHLLNFLDVTSGGPETFLERNILRLPEAKSPSMAHGTAIHAALEHAQKLINLDAFNIELIKTTYTTILEREHLPRTEHQRYVSHGHSLLERLFNEGLFKIEKGSSPEQNISDVRLNNARLGGKLDLISDANDHIIVSDYKTGRPLSNFATRDAAQEVKAWKQRTQLIYYTILLRNSSRFKTENKRIVGQMIYVDAETTSAMYKQYEATIEEIERLEKLVCAVWDKIIDFDLPNISKYPQTLEGITEFENDLLAT